MNRVTLGIALLLSSTTLFAANIEKKTITSGGRERTYYLLVPESVTKEHPAPLIVMLHGSGRRGNLLLEHWKSLAEKEGIVLAGPDSLDPRAWNPPVDKPELLRDVVDDVKAIAPIDDQRVYLFGHSAGARYALLLGLLESEYFAAVFVHAGALQPDAESLLKLATRKMPFAIAVGTRDSLFPLADVRATRDLLERGGFAVELTEIPNHDHNYYEISKSINDTAWKFLKPRSLGQPQKFTVYASKGG